MTPSPAVLVVGTGSIGSRHVSNLLTLGARVFTYSYRGARADAPWAGAVTAAGSLDEALALPVDAVVVANDTDQHVDVALRAARAGRALFIEKPLSHDLGNVDRLAHEIEARALAVEAGFMLRLHPNLQWISGWLGAGELGRVHYARALVGQFLPDWRPGRDHRQCYSARRPCGGVVFDLIHEIDLMHWLLGPAVDVQAMLASVEALEIETEAVAQILLRTQAGALAQVHLDYVRPVFGRTLEITGERGVLTWDYDAGTVALMERGRAVTVLHTVPDGFARNDLFVAHMRHFLARVSDPQLPAVSSFADGVAALRVALACHRSARDRRAVRPSEVGPGSGVGASAE